MCNKNKNPCTNRALAKSTRQYISYSCYCTKRHKCYLHCKKTTVGGEGRVWRGWDIDIGSNFCDHRIFEPELGVDRGAE